MVRPRYSISGLLILLATLFPGSGWGQSIETEVELVPREVRVGQPAVATIRVYTSTWFTDAVDFKNLTMDNGLIVPYKQTLSISKRVGRQTLPGIQFSYLVFPLDDGAVFPALDLVVTSPPEGDFVGRQIRVQTPPRPLNITPLPEGITPDMWLPASQVRIEEDWTVPEEPKVGDVLERRISITAWGTLSHFIPEPAWDDSVLASSYLLEARTSDNKEADNLYGSRTQTIRYLLEEEGSFSLPALELEWFHTPSSEFRQATLPPFNLEIAPNPDLGYGTSLEDRLNEYRQSLEPAPVEEPIPWNTILLAALAFLALIVLGSAAWRRLRTIALKLAAARHHYRESEGFAFSRLRRSASADDRTFLRQSLGWFDRFRTTQPPSLGRTLGAREGVSVPDSSSKAKTSGKQVRIRARSEWSALNDRLFRPGTTVTTVDKKRILKGLKSIRKDGAR